MNRWYYRGQVNVALVVAVCGQYTGVRLQLAIPLKFF